MSRGATVDELIVKYKKLSEEGLGDYEVITNLGDHWIGVSCKDEEGIKLTEKEHGLKQGCKVVGFYGYY